MAAQAPAQSVAFGKYNLLRKLAKGGMAELFLATDPADRQCVIKRVLPQFTSDGEFLSMFLNEARIAAQLAHPNIVQILDLGQENGHLYIAMEFIDGYNVERIAKACGHKVQPALAAHIGSEVCGALFFANRMTDRAGQPLNVVHRDVTPGNVMVTRAGEVKLVDFGIAKATDQLERTRPGIVKGKFRYLSPEQIEQKELDGRSDLFSVAVMLYEITTATRPFDRKTIFETFTAISKYMPPPPSEVVPGFPVELSAAIMKGLAKKRDERYPDAREFQLALARCSVGVGQPELAAYLGGLIRAQPDLFPQVPERRASPPAPPPPPPPSRSLADPPPSAVERTTAVSGEEMRRLLEEADRKPHAKVDAGLQLGDGAPEPSWTDPAAPPPAPNPADVRTLGARPSSTGLPPPKEAARPVPARPSSAGQAVQVPPGAEMTIRKPRSAKSLSDALGEPQATPELTTRRIRSAGRWRMLVVTLIVLAAAAGAWGWLFPDSARGLLGSVQQKLGGTVAPELDAPPEAPAAPEKKGK